MAKDIILVENDVNSLKAPMEQLAEQALKHFDGELIKIRTGRAHTSLVEDILVEAYGQNPTPLKGLAAIATPTPRMITIQPWDASIIGDIERAINTSDIGITPANDGKVVRLTLPEMSSTRRDDLVKILGKRLEECRIAIRNIRKDFNNAIRDAKRDKTISEDFHNRLGDVLQEVTNNYIKKAEQKAEQKEKEIRTV